MISFLSPLNTWCMQDSPFGSHIHGYLFNIRIRLLTLGKQERRQLKESIMKELKISKPTLDRLIFRKTGENDPINYLILKAFASYFHVSVVELETNPSDSE